MELELSTLQSHLPRHEDTLEEESKLCLRQYDLLVKKDYLAKVQLKKEIAESNEMLSMLMPSFVVERLTNFEISKNFVADDAGEVAILFCDLCYFDELIKECQDSIVDILDQLFRAFDATCRVMGVQKIETVGKTYMACAGLKFVEKNLSTDVRNLSSVKRVLMAAQEMQNIVNDFMYQPGKSLKIKIGIHYGTCIFGVLGYHKPQFSLIGDTINTTSRHCTTGDPGCIVLSESAWNRIKKFSKTKVETRSVDMKGKGSVQTYVVVPEEKRKRKKNIGTIQLEDFKRSANRSGTLPIGNDNKKPVPLHMKSIKNIKLIDKLQDNQNYNQSRYPSEDLPRDEEIDLEVEIDNGNHENELQSANANYGNNATNANNSNKLGRKISTLSETYRFNSSFLSEDLEVRTF